MDTVPNSTVESFTLVCGPTSAQAEVTIAVGVFDPSADRLFMRFRADLEEVIHEDEIEVISSTEEHFLTLVAENGARETFRWMRETLSNFLRFNDLGPLKRPRDFAAALEKLYDQRIALKRRAASANRR